MLGVRRMIGVQGVVRPVRMGHLPALVVMAMVVVAVLAVRVLVAVMAFAVVHVLGRRRIRLGRGLRAGRFI